MGHHSLLTGAGFSRNWGGWLVNEAFEYLLGSKDVDDRVRDALWKAKERRKGFEDVLSDMQKEVTAHPGSAAEQRLQALTDAISMMFAEMGTGYRSGSFEPQNDVAYTVQSFLERFDAIYTLNQDDLIEAKYAPKVRNARIAGVQLPGVKSGNSAVGMAGTTFTLFEPDPSNFRLDPRMQPYIKLHGSFTWMEGPKRLLIVGGNKKANIEKSPLLKWYSKLFEADLHKPNSKLMIIGYSFNDQHINEYIISAVAGGLKIFIIDPSGVDVLDKRDPSAAIRPPPESLLEKLSPGVIGASRRPLTSTFNQDRVEHGKIMRFFA